MNFSWKTLILVIFVVLFIAIGECLDILGNNGEEELNSDVSIDQSAEANDSSLITNESLNDTKKFISCKLISLNTTWSDSMFMKIEIMNASRLAELLTPNADITNRESEALCSVIFFYSKYCTFSGTAAPAFSALSKLYPDIKMAAVDSVQHNRINTQYGIVGVPSIILFHNARAVAKYNGSEYTVVAFSKFIATYTGLSEANITLADDDFVEFIPKDVEEEIDYILLLAWTFVIVVLLYYFSKTRIWSTIVETFKNSWREAEAQHEHAD